MIASARWAGVVRGAGVGVLLLLGCHSSSAPGGGAAGTGGGAAGTGGGASGTGGGASGTGGVQTTHITAANGGKITDPGGNTTLTIPAGALAVDTDITLQIVLKYAEALVPVSVFGPEGLAFSKAATLAIKADPSLMPAGTELVIGLEGSDGAFAPVAGSAYADGAATAPVMHFSNYTVMTGPAHPNCSIVGQGCGDLAHDFHPCCEVPTALYGQPECQANTYKCCVQTGEACSSSTDCCGYESNNLPGTPSDSICQLGTCCPLPGSPCSDKIPCCGGNACNGGICAPS